MFPARASCILLLLALCVSEDSYSAEPETRLDGTWDIITRDFGNGPLDCTGFTMVISKGKIVVHAPTGATKTMGQITRLDPSTNPKELDFVNNGLARTGLFSLEGDKFALIVNNPGKPRPTEIRGSSSAMMYTLRRAQNP